MKIRLADIAHARRGDKADRVDFGLFAWNAAGYEVAAALLRMTIELSEREWQRWRNEPRVGGWPDNAHDDPLAAQ